MEQALHDFVPARQVFAVAFQPMNGTLKSLLAVAGLWVGSVVAWTFIVGIAAAAAGPGMGTALTLAMVTAWGSALALAIAAVALGKSLLWRWLAEGGARLGLLALFAVVQAGTCAVEAFSVFVIFNR